MLFYNSRDNQGIQYTHNVRTILHGILFNDYFKRTLCDQKQNESSRSKSQDVLYINNPCNIVQ